MADSKAATKKREKNAAPKAVTNPDAGSNKLFVLALGAILVVGLAAIALVVTNRQGTNFDGPQTAAVELGGNILIPMSGGGISADPSQDAAIGQPAPSITGTDFDGSEITITDDGRAKVVYFLAHWCSHCQAEVPRVVELIDSGAKPDNLDIYAVSTSVDPIRGNYPASFWLDRENFTAPTIRDNETNDALNFFGGSGFPYVVYIDADNTVVARSSGELDPTTIQSMWEITAGNVHGESSE